MPVKSIRYVVRYADNSQPADVQVCVVPTMELARQIARLLNSELPRRGPYYYAQKCHGSTDADSFSTGERQASVCSDTESEPHSEECYKQYCLQHGEE